MPEIINVHLEDWPRSPVIRRVRADYCRWPAHDFRDMPAALTERQAVFYRNLVRLAAAIGSRDLPVDFFRPDDSHVFLDRECIKIAEHAGFIEQLSNGRNGVVDTIRLAWLV